MRIPRPSARELQARPRSNPPGQPERNGAQHSGVRLSVIIASYDSEAFLDGCLESLARQPTRQQFEVIVVDSSTGGNGSRLRERYPWVLVHSSRRRLFCGDARNIGISMARGDIIAFLDADCVADENWTEEILKAHQSPAAVIGGSIANADSHNLVGWASYFCEFTQWMPAMSRSHLRDMAGANVSYKRPVLEKFTPFVEGTYCSDTELHWRMADAGYRVSFIPSIRVSHRSINNLPGFIQHEYMHGKSFGRMRTGNARFPRWKRIVYAGCVFVIPMVLFVRILLRNLRNRLYLLRLLQSWPVLLMGLLSWSIGECTAYMNARRTPGLAIT